MGWIRTNYGLCLALLLAAAVRVLWLHEQCFNMDEVNELRIACRPAADIIWHADSMPPGYSLLLKAWRWVFGTDMAGRWLSVLFGVAAVVCVAGIGRELFDAPTAAASAGVLAILPLHVYFSQFVRVYALFFFAAALALWLLLLAVRRGRLRYWLGYAMTVTLGMYLHYYFAIVIVMGLVVIVIERRSWRIGTRAAWAHAAVGLMVAPLCWLVPSDLALQRHAISVRPLGFDSYGFTYLTFFTGGSLGPSLRELHDISVPEAALQMAPWAALIGAVVLFVGYDGWRAAREHRAAATLVVLLFAPPLVVGAMGYALGVTYHFRFVIWCMIPAAIWLGAGLVRSWPSARSGTALAALVIVCGFALYNRNFVPRYENEDLRSTANYLAAQAAPGEPVFVLSDYLASVLRYHMTSPHDVIELPVPGEVWHELTTSDDVTTTISSITDRSGAGGYWLVYSRPFHGDPHGLLPTALQSRDRLVTKQEFAGVTLYYWAPSQPAT